MTAVGIGRGSTEGKPAQGGFNVSRTELAAGLRLRCIRQALFEFGDAQNLVW